MEIVMKPERGKFGSGEDARDPEEVWEGVAFPRHLWENWNKCGNAQSDATIASQLQSRRSVPDLLATGTFLCPTRRLSRPQTLGRGN